LTKPTHSVCASTVVNHNAPLTADADQSTTTPFSGFDLPSTLRETLILTNTGAGRFPTGADTSGMLTALQAFCRSLG